MKKKMVALLLTGAMVAGMFAGCGSKAETTDAAKTDDTKTEETKEEETADEEEKEEEAGSRGRGRTC